MVWIYFPFYIFLLQFISQKFGSFFRRRKGSLSIRYTMAVWRGLISKNENEELKFYQAFWETGMKSVTPITVLGLVRPNKDFIFYPLEGTLTLYFH